MSAGFCDDKQWVYEDDTSSDRIFAHFKESGCSSGSWVVARIQMFSYNFLWFIELKDIQTEWKEIQTPLLASLGRLLLSVPKDPHIGFIFCFT